MPLAPPGTRMGWCVRYRSHIYPHEPWSERYVYEGFNYPERPFKDKNGKIQKGVLGIVDEALVELKSNLDELDTSSEDPPEKPKQESIQEPVARIEQEYLLG